MYADLLKYFAIALFSQIAFLVVYGAAIFGSVQYEAYNAVMLLTIPIFIIYAWPWAPFGFGGGFGIILSAPVLVVLYSLIFSVVKIRRRDRYRGA